MQTEDAQRRRIHEQERRLLEEGRLLVEFGLHTADKLKASTAGVFWSRLNAVDFMNSSLQFAALAVLCLFPFLVTVSAEAGGDARHALIARLGLNKQAASDVDHLMSAGGHAVTDLSIFGALLVVLGALGIASTLQAWYQRVYDQSPARRWTRQVADRLVWLAGLVIYLVIQDFCWTKVQSVDAGRMVFYLVTFALALLFYWWTPHVLLLGAVSWRRLSVNVVFLGGGDFDCPPPLGTTGRTRYFKVSTQEEAQRPDLHQWIVEASRTPGWM